MPQNSNALKEVVEESQMDGDRRAGEATLVADALCLQMRGKMLFSEQNIAEPSSFRALWRTRPLTWPVASISGSLALPFGDPSFFAVAGGKASQG